MLELERTTAARSHTEDGTPMLALAALVLGGILVAAGVIIGLGATSSMLAIGRNSSALQLLGAAGLSWALGLSASGVVVMCVGRMIALLTEIRDVLAKIG